MNSNNKKEIKIAIPTNDGENIFTKMLGRAKEFHIYEVNEKKFRFIEKRNNPYENTMQHLKTLDLYELISDCDIIISGRIGKKGIKRLEERNMKLFFRNGGIKEALINLVRKEKFYQI
ncbi:MAG: hypothetical protein KAW92_05200 [Candidatus Cloacimonetes bacterium]|nr:hypothetical protein [Candidatus Cloacimonadota bacterium]